VVEWFPVVYPTSIEKLLQRMTDLARLPLVSQASSHAADQSIAALASLQHDGSAIGTALPLIELPWQKSRGSTNTGSW
jgi:hypothetical protein